MAQGWSFLLLTLGVCGLSSSVPNQFHLVKEEKTWAAAQQHCRKEFTDLATIDNMAEIDEVKTVIQDENVGNGAWIGLKYGNSPKWRWSLANKSFYRENEADFRNWDKNQPNLGKDEDYVGINLKGKWHDFGEHRRHGSVCHNGRNSTHPYVLVKDTKTWTEAQSHCRREYTDLASVRNQAENDKIKDLISGLGKKDYVWFGLFREEWEWSDGQNEVEFQNWGPNQPQGRTGEVCVAFKKDENGEKDGKWFDRFCSKTHAFICYDGTHSTHHFVLVEDRKNWTEAQRYCRANHTDLASVRNQQEHNEIKDLIQNLTFRKGEDQKVWIGLFRDPWEWSDGSGSSFRHWAPGEPNYGDDKAKYCVQIQSSGQWNDVVCFKKTDDNRAYFVCYEALPTVVVVSPQSPFYSGDDVTLSCDIPKHTGQHQYGWLKDNSPVPGETSQAITITLPKDLGQYQCHRRREGSSVEPYTSKPVTIENQDLPAATVEVVSPQSPFYSGDVVTLSCDIPGYSDWQQYVWLKDSTPVPGKTNQTITITLPLEAGQYQCSGGRGDRPMVSSISSSVNITINDLPNAAVEVVSPQSPFYSGDDITLRCDIPEYSDWHQYVWLKNSSPVPGKTNQTITITLPEDVGRYQCYRQRRNLFNTSSVSSSVPVLNTSSVSSSVPVLNNGEFTVLNTSSVSNSVPVLNNDKLVLVKKEKSWKEALEYCRQHHVDLVSVSSEKIQRWVEGWAKGASTPYVWLGLRYSCNLGFWFWVSGEIICYDNWASDQESGRGCTHKVGAVNREGGRWASFEENAKHNFICTKEGQWN